MAKLVITIDGPAGSGKSTAARLLAKKMGAAFLDTGAMYRAVTFAAMQKGLDLSDEDKLAEMMDNTRFVFSAADDKMTAAVDGEDVTEQLRRADVTANARHIAVKPKLRQRLVEMQRQFTASHEKIVTEGRDQGTVAFPDANFKFFLTADITERARRRLAELPPDCSATLEQIKAAIEQRDKSDEGRAVGPLLPAKDGIIIDTTAMTIDEVVAKLLGIVFPCPDSNHPLTNVRDSDSRKIPRMLWFRFARWVCKIFCVMFLRMKIIGLENVPEEGPLLLLSNHQSFFDPVFCGIFIKRPLFFLARDTLFKNPFFGRIIASVNTIPVRRGEADVAAVKAVIAKLKEGFGVCLFPEGTRSPDGKIADFKPGLGILCRRGNAVIVPVVIDGAFECWPKSRKIFKPGGKIVITYGKPILPQAISDIDDRTLAENLTRTLRQMQTACRKEQGKEPFQYQNTESRI